MQLNMNDLPYQAINLPEEVKMYHYAGDFEGEIACIDRWLRRDIPHCLRKRLEIQRLFAEHLVDDYPLTRADVGIAIGAGADVALDAADAVLVHSRLSDVPAAIRLSRATLRNIHQNLFWAFCYNTLGIPLAAGVFIPLWGWELNPMFGAAAMALSSFCVVTNALRLNLFDLRDARKFRRRAKQYPPLAHPTETQQESEEYKMEKILKIEGMMCPRCEAHVVKALLAVEGVAEAVADHTANTAKVTLSAPVADEVLTAAVEAEDYKVLGIE